MYSISSCKPGLYLCRKPKRLHVMLSNYLQVSVLYVQSIRRSQLAFRPGNWVPKRFQRCCCAWGCCYQICDLLLKAFSFHNRSSKNLANTQVTTRAGRRTPRTPRPGGGASHMSGASCKAYNIMEYGMKNRTIDV